jgi:hypothetical protein
MHGVEVIKLGGFPKLPTLIRDHKSNVYSTRACMRKNN